MANEMPRVGDEAFVWWNTGRKAPEWAGAYYMATVRAVRPYVGRFDFVTVIVELDPAVTSLTRKPVPMSVEKGNCRLLARTHPRNPENRP